jgi:hypothetical protein
MQAVCYQGGDMNFRNVEQILTFAFSVDASPILKTTTFGESIPVTGEKYSQQDLHAQSIMIIKALGKSLDELLLSFVLAKFSPEPDVVRFSLRELAYYKVVDFAGVNKPLALDLTGRHFSSFRRQRETMRELAYNHGMALRTLERREQKVTECLNGLWFTVESLMEPIFIESGLINQS